MLRREMHCHVMSLGGIWTLPNLTLDSFCRAVEHMGVFCPAFGDGLEIWGFPPSYRQIFLCVGPVSQSSQSVNPCVICLSLPKIYAMPFCECSDCDLSYFFHVWYWSKARSRVQSSRSQFTSTVISILGKSLPYGYAGARQGRNWWDGTLLWISTSPIGQNSGGRSSQDHNFQPARYFWWGKSSPYGCWSPDFPRSYWSKIRKSTMRIRSSNSERWCFDGVGPRLTDIVKLEMMWCAIWVWSRIFPIFLSFNIQGEDDEVPVKMTANQEEGEILMGKVLILWTLSSWGTLWMWYGRFWSPLFFRVPIVHRSGRGQWGI